MGKNFLVIDDSALMRRVISDIIKQNSECDVLDVAADGVDGLDKIIAHPKYYDLIFLDFNMPRMNGLEVLEHLKKNKIHEAVVVVSTVTTKDAAETMKALELGALDFITKPENFYEVRGEGFKTAMVNMINLITGRDYNRNRVVNVPKPAPVYVNDNIKSVPHKAKGSNRLVAIACSTGGPKSLQQVIPLLPENLAAPVVLVQHMPRGFTESLANRLADLSKIKVSEAVDGEILENGHVYIAPGGIHMEIAYENGNHIVRYNDAPSVDGLKPCANIMYESLLNSCYDNIICVVLTGMGSDGTKGIRKLSEGKHTYVIGQEEHSCVVYGMPRSLFEAGLTDEVRPLEEIAQSIIRNVGVS